jgi:hypothetical protein
MYGTNHGVPGISKYDQNFKLLDMRFRYNSETVYETFEKIGNDGLIAYRNFLMLDFVFITFFLLFMISISLKVTDNNFIRNVLIFSASVRALFDIIENSILLKLIKICPEKNIALANICSWSTTLKFISLYVWIIFIFISIFI